MKIDEKGLSRIVTATLDPQERTALKPNYRDGRRGVRDNGMQENGVRENSPASFRSEQQFDANGRTLKMQRKYQKVYRKQ